MHVLITGASGFIGRALTEGFVRSGHNVRCLSRANGFDVTRWEDVSKLERADVVCHLASRIARNGNPLETYTVNCLGTLHVLEYCRLRAVPHLVLASSYVYGQPQYVPIDEGHAPQGQDPYSFSKIVAETLSKGYAHHHRLSVVALRIFNAYGVGQRGRTLLPTILSQLTETGEVVLTDPWPRRDFVYIDDIVSAFLAAGHDVGEGFRSYNVASGCSVSVEEVVSEISTAWGREFPVRYTGKRRKYEILDCFGSNRLAAEKLGWQPTVSLSDGIGRTVRWWRRTQ